MTNPDNSTAPSAIDSLKREAALPCQLYLISPPAIDAGFAEILRVAADGGAIAAFQLRLKGIDDHAIAKLAEPVQKLCADLDISFLVNDSIAMAKRLGADGVHLGQSDGDPREARDVLGRDAQIGVTCHNSRHLAMEAGEAGADYVAFGAMFQSGTKEAKLFADTDIVNWWSLISPIPCVAIGGITPNNVRPVIEAGADFIAVSGAVWTASEGPTEAVRRFHALFGQPAV